MTMLKVWGRKNSMNVQKVMWALAEIDVVYERVDAGMHFGVVDETWFGDVNPNRTVPVLDDDGHIVWESNVIIRYLAAKYASGMLIPADNDGRSEIEMWMDWQQTVVMPGLGPVFVGLVRTPEAERDHAAIAAGEATVRTSMEVLDNWLSDRQFMMGDRLTAADIPLGCVAYRWLALPVQHGDIPNVRAWHERLAERAGFAEHVMLPLT